MRVIIAFSVIAALLTGCFDSEVEKQAKEGTELSKKMGDNSREVPRVVLTPDKLKAETGGK